MSLSLQVTWGTPPADEITDAQWIAFIQSIAIQLLGTVGTSDIEAGAIVANLVRPDNFNWSGSTYDGGTNTYTINPPNGSVGTWGNGTWIFFRSSGTCAVGPVYANVSATGATEIKQRGVALRAGDIRADQQYLLILNATDDYWELISVPGNPSDRYQSEVVTGTNDYVLTLDPAMTALVDGEKVRFKVPNTNTGNCRLNVSSLGLKSIYKFNTSQTLVNLSPGDLPATGIVECVYTSSSDAYILLTPIPVATVAVIASGRNVVVTNSTVARVTCTADEVILKTTGSTPQIYLASSVSTFADMGATGAGGLDTGAEGASRWYYFWLIYNPSTGMVNGLISESSTAPTLPSGYTYRALLGAVYNDSGGDFDDFYQHDRRAIIPAQSVFNDTTGVTSWTSQTLTAIVPPIAKRVSGFAGCTAGAGGAIAVAADGSGTGAQVVSGANTGAPFGEYVVGGCWSVVLKTAQTIYWQAGATTANNFGIQVSGYEI